MTRNRPGPALGWLRALAELRKFLCCGAPDTALIGSRALIEHDKEELAMAVKRTLRSALVAMLLVAGSALAVPAAAAADPTGLWHDQSTPVSPCGTGLIESYVDGQLRGWTSTCADAPAGAAYGVFSYIGSVYLGGLVVRYGPADQTNEFAIPFSAPAAEGAQISVCLGGRPQQVLAAQTVTRCLTLGRVGGEVVVSRISVKAPVIVQARWIQVDPIEPACGTCLVRPAG